MTQTHTDLIAEAEAYFASPAVATSEARRHVATLITALRAAEAENARLSEENRALRTNYRSGTSEDLNASDMRNIPDQEDDVSEAQEWEDFDRDC